MENEFDKEEKDINNVETLEIAGEKEDIIIDDTNSISDNLEDESKEEHKRFKALTIVKRLLGLTLSALICLNIQSAFSLYCLSRNEYFSDDNLFSGNSFSEDVSDEDIKNIVLELEEHLGCEIVEANEDEYCLLKAIKDNRCLTNSEKQHFYRYIDLILDNPYLDKEEVYRSLRNVTVHNYLVRPSDVGDTTQGDYGYFNKIIRIFDKESGNTLNHEGIHCIFSNDKNRNLPKYFDEGMTELLNNEYFSDNPFYELSNYPFEIAAVKILCDLTSSDTVLKAFTYGDMNIIAEELANISGSSIDDAVDALNKLDLTFKKFKSDEFDLNDKELRISFCDMSDYFDKCITTFDEKDDRRVSYFYNLILVMNIFFEDPYQCYGDDLVEHGYESKAYFSSKLMKSATLNNESTTSKILVKSSENA